METSPKYFDTGMMIAGFEAQTGMKASGYLVELAEDIARIVNDAYKEGYIAGMKANSK